MRCPENGLPLYDALIIGAGPAGSATARQLARGGWRVLLIDREPAGRDRVCGGFLGAEASQTLWPALGLTDTVRTLPSAPVDTLRLSAPGTPRLETPLPAPGGSGVHRADFDRWLCQQAIAAGAEFLDQTMIASATRTQGIWRVCLRRPGTEQPVCTRLLIRAHGRRHPHLPTPQRSRTLFGCKTIYRNLSGMHRRVALHFVRNGHVGFNQLPDGRFTMCLYVAQARLEAVRGNLDWMMEQLAEENRHIGEALRGAERVGPWMSCKAQPDGRALFYSRGTFCVGDAVAMVNPVLGGGMSIAIGSAILLTQRLLSGRDHQLPDRLIAEQYAEAWRRQFAGRLRLGRWLARCERSLPATEAALRLLTIRPPLLSHLIRYARPALSSVPLTAA